MEVIIMGFKLYKNDNGYPGYHAEFVADARTDIESLPTDCEVGSSCIVIEDSSVWMLNTEHVWTELQ